MSGTVLCVAVVMLGVNFSVQPLPEGGVEYVIHLDPLNLESLRSGNDLRSDLPTTAKDVRSFRITLASVQPTGPALSSPAPAPTPKSRPPRTRPSVPSGSDFVIPRGGGFPTAPPGILPMPKETANPIQGERPVVPAKAEQGPIAAPAVPPAVEKPQPPRASSQTAVSAVEPETSQESPGLLYSLAASTIGSFSGMVFFGWVAWDYRRRYYSLLFQSERSFESPGSSESEPADEEPPASEDLSGLGE